MNDFKPRLILAAIASVSLFAESVNGALIPGLFNTGINTNGLLLDAAQIDPHYTLIYSEDPAFPGADAFTITPGFPVVPLWWMPEGPESRWIAPRPEAGKGNRVGSYIYRTTFDLTGFDPDKAKIIGKWAAANWGVDILLNEVSLGISTSKEGSINAFSDFTIDRGFAADANTVDFLVNNGPSSPPVRPIGLRVELHGVVDLPNEIPFIFREPEPTIIGRAGDDRSLTVLAYGSPPLMFRWRLDGVNVIGGTNATLVLRNIKLNQEGSYSVVVSNAVGSVTSASAQLTVLEPVPGLFNTGVGRDGAVLDDLAIDAHYKLTTNSDGPSTDTIVHDSSVPPFDSEKWVANSTTSKWIAPRGNTAEATAGNYIYRLEFDLSGFEPATAVITGRWATDNEGLDIRLNGISTRNRNYAQSREYTTFTITNAFRAGTNTLDFAVFNAGQNPTGLRVDEIAAGAKRSRIDIAELKLSIDSARDGMILISWPSSTVGYVLESLESFASANWKTEDQLIVTSGNGNSVTISPSGRTRFFRLRR